MNNKFFNYNKGIENTKITINSPPVSKPRAGRTLLTVLVEKLKIDFIKDSNYYPKDSIILIK